MTAHGVFLPDLGIAAANTVTLCNNNLAYPSAGNSTTLHTVAGAGVVRSWTLTNGTKALAEYGRVQFFVDGESSPSIDVELGTLFSTHEDAFTGTGRMLTNRHMTVSISGGTYNGTSCVTMTFPVPFSNGLIIKFYNPSEAASNQMYSTLDYQPGAVAGVTGKYRLRAIGVPYKTPLNATALAALPFFDITNAAGSLVYFAIATQGQADYSNFERPVDIWVDGENTPSYRGNAEDWWGSGFFFGGMSGFSSAWSLLTAGNNTNKSAYAGIDLLERLGGVKFSTELKMAWGRSNEVKPQDFTDTSATVGFVALYYIDISVPFAPGPPVVTGVPNSTSLTVNWSVPLSTGSSPITGYKVTLSPGGATTTVGAGTFTATFNSLSNGTTYTATVQGINSVGNGVGGTVATLVRVPVVPGAPTGVATSPLLGAASVTWSAPADNGGRPVTGYTITATPHAGGSAITATSTTTSGVIAGLTGGTLYDVTVHATNSVGSGSESVSASVTPGTLPTLPTITSGTYRRYYSADSISASLYDTTISGWVDNLLNGDLSQSTASFYPTLRGSLINGLPALQFGPGKGFDGTLTDSLPRTVFAVVKPSTLGQGNVVYAGSNERFGMNSANQWVFFGGTADAGLVSATTSWAIVSFVANGASSTVYLNGAAGTTVNAGTGPGTNSLQVGKGAAYFDGYIEEIIIADGALNTTDRRAIEAFLASRTGITVV